MDKKVKKEYDRKYYVKNKKKRKEQQRECYTKHKEEILEKQKEYYIDHREERNEYQREYDRRKRVEMPWVTHFTSAKQRCTNPSHTAYKYYGGKGIEFKLTMEEVWYLYERDNAKDMKKPSIDRIYGDSNYTFGNCRFIEQAENSRLGAAEMWGKV